MKTQRIGSIFGDSFKTSYITADILKKGSTVLIPDTLDGWNTLPFLSKRMKVTAYESDSLFIDGGTVTQNDKEIQIYGLNKRLEAYGYSENIEVINENFYTSNSNKKYDFIYVHKSLHRDCNSNLTIEQKIKKLQNSVKTNGSIYINYHLPIDDEKDYPSNSYPNKYEIVSYFKSSDWEIIAAQEKETLRYDKGHLGNELPHYHKIGYLHAKKSRKKKTKNGAHIYRNNISIGSYF